MVGRLVIGMLFVVCLLNVVLPPSTYSGSISKLHSEPAQINLLARNRGPVYIADIDGERPGTCRMPFAAFTKLKEGDRVQAKVSRVFRDCVEITSNDVAVDAGEGANWRIGYSFPVLIFGLISLYLFAKSKRREPL